MLGLVADASPTVHGGNRETLRMRHFVLAVGRVASDGPLTSISRYLTTPLCTVRARIPRVTSSVDWG